MLNLHSDFAYGPRCQPVPAVGWGAVMERHFLDLDGARVLPTEGCSWSSSPG
jgi:hypothetical protein